MPRYCFVDWCRESSYKNPNRRLIRYPKSTKTFLCDHHFPSFFFGKKKLKESAYEKIETILNQHGIEIPTMPLPEKIKRNKRKYSRRCVIKHCQLTDLSIPPVKFLIFPKRESDLYDAWVDKCELSKEEDAKVYKYVCEKHFLEKGDEVPNCNLTSHVQLEKSEHEDVECNANETEVTHAPNNCNQNIEGPDPACLISTLNVTLIEDFTNTHCQDFKVEPELEIEDVVHCVDIDFM